jgi:hypothetical protein
MRALARRLAASTRDDRGVALVVVIGIGMLMLILVATALTVAVSGLNRTDTDQDYNGALDAAYAGVAEYQSRLAMDTSYYTYGNKDAPFSKATGSTYLTLPTGTAANPAFGATASGTWATVPGSSPVASFRYEVDSSKYSSTGVVRIRSTGRVGNVTRSVVADLKQSGFIDFLYFTDYEVQDPELTGRTDCAKHIWEGRPSSCQSIQFANGDVIDGPLHSNDTLTICGTRFKGKVTTSNYKTPVFVKPSNCTPTFEVAPYAPEPHPEITMPTTNTEMKKETRNDLPGEVPLPGCLYTGPTVITFTSDGKMNIKSPWTRKTRIAAVAANSTEPAECGLPGSGAGRLGSPEGATINVLPANVIYVQNVPTVSGDPNLPTSSATPSGFSCVNSNGGWTLGSGSARTQFPAVDEDVITGASPYGCRSGDVFVKGTFKGAMTIAAENYVYITGDLTYSDTAKDILGLVGNGAVWIWNPMKTTTVQTGWSWWPTYSTETRPLLTDSSRTVHAAILSVAHTFQVQNYDQGTVSRGTLTVKGSIAQAFRGPVGQSGGSGYLKDYRYDTRFAYMAPPKFLSPVSSSYGVSQYAGVDAAFDAKGAPR